MGICSLGPCFRVWGRVGGWGGGGGGVWGGGVVGGGRGGGGGAGGGGGRAVMTRVIEAPLQGRRGLSRERTSTIATYSHTKSLPMAAPCYRVGSRSESDRHLRPPIIIIGCVHGYVTFDHHNL